MDWGWEVALRNRECCKCLEKRWVSELRQYSKGDWHAVCLGLWGAGVIQAPLLYSRILSAVSCSWTDVSHSCEVGSKIRKHLCHHLGGVTLLTLLKVVTYGEMDSIERGWEVFFHFIIQISALVIPSAPHIPCTHWWVL